MARLVENHIIPVEEVKPKVLNVDGASVYIGRSPAQIRRMVKTGELKAISGERTMQFTIDYLDKWLEDKMIYHGNCVIMSISNQKGGVGKTASTLNIGFILASRGYKVLLIDTDPQATLSGYYNLEGLLEGTVYTLINEYFDKKQNKIKSHIHDTLQEAEEESDDYKGKVQRGHDNLKIIPGDLRLGHMFDILNNKIGGNKVFKHLLEDIKEDYDFILFDTPPSRLDSGMLLSLTASTHIVTPVKPDKHSYDAMNTYLDTVDDVVLYENPNLRPLGIMVFAADTQTKVHTYFMQELPKKYDVFSQHISDKIQAIEAEMLKKTLAEFEGGYELTTEYSAVVDEILNKLEIIKNEN